MRTKILVLLSVFFVMLFSIGISARTCTIESSCDADKTIMKLSGTTNAHGEIWSQTNYAQYLCCDFTGTRTCSGNNKILKLSGITDAHAEVPTGTNYNTDVCFGNLNCGSTTSSCSGNNKIVLRLSGTTNAHIAGPLETNYGTLICCDFSFVGDGIITGDEECDDSNTASGDGCSSTGTIETGWSCLGEPSACILDCTFTSSNWGATEVADRTLVGLNVYGTGDCNGKNVIFDIGEVDIGSDYEGKDNADTAKIISPQVSITATCSGDVCTASASWTAEWILDENNFLGDDDPEYVFKASLETDPSVKIDDSGQLKVLPNYGDGIISGPEECDDGNTNNWDGCSSTGRIEPGFYCSDEPSVCTRNCAFTSAEWSSSEVSVGTNVNLNVQGNGYCDGESVKFEVFEKELPLMERDPVVTNPANAVFNGNSVTGTWIAEWIDDEFGQGDPEYVFRASLVSAPSVEIDNSGELKVLPDSGGGGGEPIECSNITSCSNYLTKGECVTDSCDITEGSVEANNPLISCGEEGVSCECAWISNSCEPSYTSVAGGYIVGTCSYDEDTDDDCEDRFLSYSWAKSWTWGHSGWANWTNSGISGSVIGDYELDNLTYYYDPYGKFDGCQDGSTLVECPESIQLGFFGFWNFIISVIILVGIYSFFERNKN